MNIKPVKLPYQNQAINIAITESNDDQNEKSDAQSHSVERVIVPSLFQLCADVNTPKVIVVTATKHSEWDSNKHWLEIKTSDDKVYRSYLTVNKLAEIENLSKGEVIIIQNEQILFSRFGYSTFDLSIPRLKRTLKGEGVSTLAYSPVHIGSEVHAVFEANVDQAEKSVSFKIENGKTIKLFFNEAFQVEDLQNGQEFEIFYEKSFYEKKPFLLLGIKNLETNKEYIVKAEAFSRWQPRKEDLYRVMTLKRYTIPETEYAHERHFDQLYPEVGQPYSMGHTLPKPIGLLGDKVMVLEHVATDTYDFGMQMFTYKFLNLRTGEIYDHFTSDPQFHKIFNTPFGNMIGRLKDSVKRAE